MLEEKLKLVEEENKIVAKLREVEIGEIEYQEVKDNLVDIYHTYVDPDYQGQHIASILTEYLFKKLKKENKKAICSCSYVDHWIKKHQEYQNIWYKEEN